MLYELLYYTLKRLGLWSNLMKYPTVLFDKQPVSGLVFFVLLLHQIQI